MAYGEELDIANALTRARQRLRESSSSLRRLPRPAQTQLARARERLGSLAVRNSVDSVDSVVCGLCAVSQGPRDSCREDLSRLGHTQL